MNCMKQLLNEYTQYNVWANEIICSFLQQLTPAQVNLQQASSFNSILNTVVHIADCEFNWLKRINGNSVWESKSTIEVDFTALLEFWIKQSKQFVVLVEREDQFTKIIDYKNSNGVPFQMELYKIFMHVMNHSTYHRGQLVTLLRGAGFTELSTTDLVSFYRL